MRMSLVRKEEDLVKVASSDSLEPARVGRLGGRSHPSSCLLASQVFVAKEEQVWQDQDS